MSYTPHEWRLGERVTPDRINNMEEGIRAANEDVSTNRLANNSVTEEKLSSELQNEKSTLQNQVLDLQLNTLNSAIFGLGANNHTYELGAISSTSGLNTDSTTRIRTVNMFLCTAGTVISRVYNDNQRLIYVHLYNFDGSYYGNSGGWVTSYTVPNNYLVRIVTRRDQENSAYSSESDISFSVSMISIDYNQIVINSKRHDFDLDPVMDSIITVGESWSTGQETARSKVFKIEKSAYEILVIAQGSTVPIAFLKAYTPSDPRDRHPFYSTEYPSRISLAANETRSFIVRGDMNYMYVGSVNSNGTNILPTVIVKSIKSNDDVPFLLEAVDTESEDETGKMDRSDEIKLMLSRYGKCQLGKGIFYVNSVYMPSNTALVGCSGTVIKLLDSSSTNGRYAITLGDGCVIKDLTIKGAYTYSRPDTTGNRSGIRYYGTTTDRSYVLNCTIYNFVGSGIFISKTTETVYGLTVSDCHIHDCAVGIYMYKNTTNNMVQNCAIVDTNYAVVIRGHGNVISNCSITNPNKSGIMVNSGDGGNTIYNGEIAITGCAFWSDNTNQDYPIYALKVDSVDHVCMSNCTTRRMALVSLESAKNCLISNCSVHTLENDGITEPFEGSVVYIYNGYCSVVANCTFFTSLHAYIRSNDSAKVINCYDYQGGQIDVVRN